MGRETLLASYGTLFSPGPITALAVGLNDKISGKHPDIYENCRTAFDGDQLRLYGSDHENDGHGYQQGHQCGNDHIFSINLPGFH
jgi:hypothetical protein